MRRPASSIMFGLTVLSYLSAPRVLAGEPTPDEMHMPLTSVTKRPSHVFASIPDGLFRASLQTKRWEKLTTPPTMPADGTFAALPANSTLVIYIANRATSHVRPRPDDRSGLYLSRDDGATWELMSGRDDFGPALLLPGGGLFAITGYRDFADGGDHLLRSADLGKTWRDISGDWHVNLMGLEPDPDHPGLVRLRGWAFRECTIVADDANYRWRTVRGSVPAAGRRPSNDFFARSASTTNRLYSLYASMSNYFDHDFGNLTHDHAIEVVPLKPRFEFRRGMPVVVPIRVVFHYDEGSALAHWRKLAAGGKPSPKPTPPVEKFADQPGRTDFWGIRVETPEAQVEKYPTDRDVVTTIVDDKNPPITTQPPRVAYRIFDLSPSTPYERELDLGRLADFSRPGEYRVQLIYSSGGNPDNDKGEWDGSFTGPVFTVVIRQ